MASAITWCPSPNFGPRRDGLKPGLIVLHYTAMQTGQAACERLCDPSAEVSAHYLISETGAVTQFVDEKERAWHAGEGSWQGMDDINSRSIGIELANRGDHPFPEPQMTCLEGLLRDIMQRWNIAPNGVIGHSDMAPGRKFDPGPHFDWARLARQGLAGKGLIAPLGGPVSETVFRESAVGAGYSFQGDLEDLLAATRLRYAPWRSGPLVKEDLTLGFDFLA